MKLKPGVYFRSRLIRSMYFKIIDVGEFTYLLKCNSKCSGKCSHRGEFEFCPKCKPDNTCQSDAGVEYWDKIHPLLGMLMVRE